MNNSKQYIIFDLDGTLVDSFPTVVNACKRVFANHAPTKMPDNDYFNTYRTQDMEKMFVELSDIAGMSRKDFRTSYDEQYALDCIAGTKPIKRQYERLKDAKRQRLGIIVLTNKRQHIAEQVCNTLFPKDEIDIVIGREDALPIKPRHVLIDRLRACNINPKTQCLMYYGDSEIDHRSADLLCVQYTSV